MKPITWWNANKVFATGLISSIALAITPFAQGSSSDTTWKVLGFAIASGALSFIANSWRGQGLSMIGIVGNLAGVGVSLIQTGHISMQQLVVQMLLAIAMTAGPDPKSRGYEQTAVIHDAKVQGEASQPAALTNIDVKKEAKAVTSAVNPGVDTNAGNKAIN